MLLVRVHYSVLCSCALSIPPPKAFGHKNRSYKAYVFQRACDRGELKWITNLGHPRVAPLLFDKMSKSMREFWTGWLNDLFNLRLYSTVAWQVYWNEIFSALWCFREKRLDRGRGCYDLRPVYTATDCHVACLNKVALVILYLQK